MMVKSESDSETAPSAIGKLPGAIKESDLPLLNEGLAFLFQELANAGDLHQSDTEAGREGVIHSVETVVNFLSLFAPVISSRLHAPLGALFDALMTLDDGKVLPLLKPEKKSGRARASALRGSLIGAVAFTVKRLTETGMHVPAAHQAVANALKRQGVKPARGRAAAMSTRTIRTWCEQVARDFGRHGEAPQTYDRLINDPSGNVSDQPPKQAQSVLLDRLADVARAIRAQEGA
jgi:hypothetical protein